MMFVTNVPIRDFMNGAVARPRRMKSSLTVIRHTEKLTLEIVPEDSGAKVKWN